MVILVIPYAFGVYPVFFLGYVSTTVLAAWCRRMSFIAMGKGVVRRGGRLKDFCPCRPGRFSTYVL